MPTPILMPKQGNSVESCVILKWHKQLGDAIQDGEPVLDVETDKAVVQVEAPTSGILLAQFFAVGQDVPVLTHVGVIGAIGEDIESLRPVAPSSPPPTQTAPDLPPTPVVVVATPSMMEVSPRARNLADQHGIALKDVQATGPNGRIIERDVQRAIADQQIRFTRLAQEQAQQETVTIPSTGTGLGGRVTSADLQITPPAQAIEATETHETLTIPLQGVRKMIAERMHQSLHNINVCILVLQWIPHVGCSFRSSKMHINVA